MSNKNTDVIKFVTATEREIDALMKKEGGNESWGCIYGVDLNFIEGDMVITLKVRVGITNDANLADLTYEVIGFGRENIKTLSGKVAYGIVQKALLSEEFNN